MNRFSNLIKSKKGETLLESLISTVIFGLIILAVMAVLTASINITKKSQDDDKANQLQYNVIELQQYNSTAYQTANIAISGETTVSQPIVVNQDNAYLAFYASTTTTP